MKKVAEFVRLNVLGQKKVEDRFDYIVVDRKDIVSFSKLLGIRLRKEDVKEIYNQLTFQAQIVEEDKLYFLYESRKYNKIYTNGYVNKNMLSFRSRQEVINKILDKIKLVYELNNNVILESLRVINI